MARKNAFWVANVCRTGWYFEECQSEDTRNNKSELSLKWENGLSLNAFPFSMTRYANFSTAERRAKK